MLQSIAPSGALTERQTRQLITAVLSAVCYGGWAFMANAGSELRLLSTLVQFVGSFAAGYVVSGFVESVHARLSAPWRYPVAALAPYWLTLLLFATVHAWVGTAEIALTLTPNFVIGTLYFLVYCRKLEENAQ